MSKAKDKIQAESLSLFQHFCLKVAVQATGYGLWPSWGTGFKGGPGTDGKLVFTALILINHFCAGSNISIISVPFPSLFLFSGVFFLPINCFSTHIFKVQNRQTWKGNKSILLFLQKSNQKFGRQLKRRKRCLDYSIFLGCSGVLIMSIWRIFQI